MFIKKIAFFSTPLILYLGYKLYYKYNNKKNWVEEDFKKFLEKNNEICQHCGKYNRSLTNKILECWNCDKKINSKTTNDSNKNEIFQKNIQKDDLTINNNEETIINDDLDISNTKETIINDDLNISNTKETIKKDNIDSENLIPSIL